MQTVRQPAVAGMFYPADPQQLQAMVANMLQAANAPQQPAPKAIIVPHAGYVYSGATAARAYARLAPARDTISRVVLLGPSHRVGFRGLAATSADLYRSPLGDISVDRPALEQALKLPQVSLLDQAHLAEHSLEVHLPFLQQALGHFSLVPLVVGDADPKEVAEVLDLLWGGPETLIVISSDLSHYHDYQTAMRMDRATSDAIEQLRLDDIGYEDACGRNPVKGLLYTARHRGLKGETIELCNSGDRTGPKDRVVGYGAYIFDEPTDSSAADRETDDGRLATSLRNTLLQVAEQSIRHGLAQRSPLPVKAADFPKALQERRATFVTLNRNGALRGCIGTLEAVRPLVEDIAYNAFAAAFSDPRFAPLGNAELVDLELHISILSPATPMQFDSEQDLIRQLRPGVDGLILVEGQRRGTFLPSVWEQLPQPHQFLQHLKLKAGLPANYWSPTLAVHRYTTESFGRQD